MTKQHVGLFFLLKVGLEQGDNLLMATRLGPGDQRAISIMLDGLTTADKAGTPHGAWLRI